MGYGVIVHGEKLFELVQYLSDLLSSRVEHCTGLFLQLSKPEG